jgi:hypothetical protein
LFLPRLSVVVVGRDLHQEDDLLPLVDQAEVKIMTNIVY